MRAVALAAFAVIGATQVASAQLAICWRGEGQNYYGVAYLQAVCNSAMHHALIAQAGAGIASVGGNPVPGASSTLGMRIGKIPRVTIAARTTGALMNVQSLRVDNSGDDEKGTARTINLDAAVGILSGWSIAPTIDGFGSLDLIASVGHLTMPNEFSEAGNSWAVGARIGILRESFTVPGVSVTGMYRSIGDMRYYTPEVCYAACETTYALTDNSVTSLRAVVGKRLFVVGANAGVGYDWFSGQWDVSMAPTEWKLEQDRFIAFGNIAWTMLFLNLVVEGGYQHGEGEFEDPMFFESRTQKSTYYGTLAVRLAL